MEVKAKIFTLLLFVLAAVSAAGQGVIDTCDYLEGGVVERQMQTAISGLLRGTGYCIQRTNVNGGLELVGADLSIIDGDTIGQVLRWTGTTWESRLIIFHGGAGVDTVYNGLTDRDSAFVMGGPLTENTRVHGQKAYDFTLDDARTLLFEAQRTSGVAYSSVRLGSTAAAGVDFAHYNEADNQKQAVAAVNYSTGNVLKLQTSSSNNTIVQQYDNGGGLLQTDISAANASASKILRLNRNEIYALYLDRVGVDNEAGFMMWDTLDGRIKYQSPDIIASQISNLLTLGRVDAVADSAAFRAYTRTGFNVVIMADSLRGGKFRRCYSCTADQYNVFTDGSGRKWERIDYKAVSVKWYGAKGNGTTNDSLAVQKALNSTYDVWFPPGTYKVGTHTVSNPKRIWGSNAILKQASRKSSGAKLLTILSSGVTVEGLEFRGQISTQTSEFSHGIVIGNESGSGVTNVTISGVKIRDVRGDGIMVVSLSDHCDNVTIKDVTIRNAYRNGIAIIAGNNINISNVDADSIGLAGIDLEPDLLEQSTKNVHVSGVKIPSFWVGHHLDTVATNITLHAFEIDGSRRGCNPDYPTTLGVTGTGIAVRHTNSFTVQDGTIDNCGDVAIYFTNGTRKSRGIRFENVYFGPNNAIGSTARTKYINRDNSSSDSCALFVNCRFDGGGVTDQVGFPVGSVIENCQILRFDRLMVSAIGKLTFRRSIIQVYDDLIYDSNGASTFENCRINCSYLLRGQTGDNMVYRFIGDTITTSVTPLPYNFFGSTPANTRFVLKDCIINGAASQSIASGGTVFHDNITVSGTSAATIVLPDLLRRPENVIKVNNLTDGRAITFDPEGSTTINGASTAVTLTNNIVTSAGDVWYIQKDGVFTVAGTNGLTASTSSGTATLKLGGTLSENTTINGANTYALTFSGFGASNNLNFTNTVPKFTTGSGGGTEFKILGEISADPTGTYITDDNAFIATTAGGSGLWSNYGTLLFGSRKNNEIKFTVDRTNPVLRIDGTEAEFYGRGTFSGNLFLKGSTDIKITNKNNFGTVPIYKENLTWQGNMWLSDGGDVPLILGGGKTAFPSSVGADLGSFIGTTGGGSGLWSDYGRLIFRPRAGKPLFVTSGSEPVLTVLNGTVGIGLGLNTPTDTLHTQGTVRHEGLPAYDGTQEYAALMDDNDRLAKGKVPSAAIAETGVTAGVYGGFNTPVTLQIAATGQVIDATQTTFNSTTYASSGGATTLTLQQFDFMVQADPTAGDLTIELSGLEQNRAYNIFGCCNLTNDIILSGSNMKFTGDYGTTSTPYTFGPGEHLEIVYIGTTYFISKK